MRISGYGSGGSGGSSSRDAAARRKAFRKQRRVGDVVHGRLLRAESDELAWVDVEGQELLAAIPSPPAPGTRLIFLVKQLEPDIVLQHIPSGQGQVVRLDALSSFWTSRANLECAVAEGFSVENENSPAHRQEAFTRWLRQNPAAAECFSRYSKAVEILNAQLQAAGAGRLLAMPWLLPEARDQELLLTKGEAMDQYTWSFTLPQLGDAEVRALAPREAGKQPSYRLLLEHKDETDAARELIHPALPLDAEPGFQGASALRPGPRGPLARLLSQAARTPGVGLSMRI